MLGGEEGARVGRLEASVNFAYSPLIPGGTLHPFATQRST